MGEEKKFKKVKLFTGVIYRLRSNFETVRRVFEQQFSPVDLVSPEFPFQFTDYYNEEMGTPLFKQFIAFQRLIEPVQLPDIKIMSNQLEIDFSSEGKRTINIDPGYLSDANVILATTKNHYHRIPLAKGIYAHMEYVIKKRNTLTPLEWTYPDFKSQEYMDYFRKLISNYKEKTKEENKQSIKKIYHQEHERHEEKK